MRLSQSTKPMAEPELVWPQHKPDHQRRRTLGLRDSFSTCGVYARITTATHTHGVHTVAEKSWKFCLSGDVPLTISAPPLSPNNTFPFPASCILLSGIIHPSCLWSLSCSTHSGIGKLHNCTTHLTFIAPLSPGHFSGLTLPTGDQWDAEFECFSGRSWVTGHYLTRPALTNIPVNHRMLGNSFSLFLSIQTCLADARSCVPRSGFQFACWFFSPKTGT